MTSTPRESPSTPEQSVRTESLVIVNTGDGKGKSSAAFGVMGRAWARGWRVVVIQFIKSAKWRAGERKLAEHLNIEWHTTGDGFTWESTDIDETIATGRHAWEVAKEKLASGDYDLVILDELTYVISYGWVEVRDVVNALTHRDRATNVIVTGRNAPTEVVELSDTVTEMTMVKHAYQRGIRAKKGIEY
ncbi:MAG: cob(I)yrinic acid a,c-diamide adenosyltransferase [Acidimicrobiales bacterium]